MKPEEQFDEAYFLKTGVKIPPPEQRLCLVHEKPIVPSAWVRGRRTSECSQCTRERTRLPQAKAKRAKKWEECFIPCAYHPNRRANRSKYVLDGRRRCSSCSLRNKPSEGGPKKASCVIRTKKHKARWSKTTAGRESQQRSWARYDNKKRMELAVQQPFKRPSIAKILHMSTGFRVSGGAW